MEPNIAISIVTMSSFDKKERQWLVDNGIQLSKLSKAQKQWLLEHADELPDIIMSAVNKEVIKASTATSATIRKIELDLIGKHFKVVDHFKISHSPKIKIIDREFLKHFGGIEEEILGPKDICFCRLKKKAGDQQIMKELGEYKLLSNFWQIFSLLKTQANGEKEPLQMSGINLFYAKNLKGEIKAIRIIWSKGWIVDLIEPDDYPYKSLTKIFFQK